MDAHTQIDSYIGSDGEVNHLIANLNSDLKLVHAAKYLGALKMAATNVWWDRVEAKAIEFANLGGMIRLAATCEELDYSEWEESEIYICYIRLVNMVDNAAFSHEEAMKIVSKYIKGFNY